MPHQYKSRFGATGHVVNDREAKERNTMLIRMLKMILFATDIWHANVAAVRDSVPEIVHIFVLNLLYYYDKTQQESDLLLLTTYAY